MHSSTETKTDCKICHSPALERDLSTFLLTKSKQSNVDEVTKRERRIREKIDMHKQELESFKAEERKTK
jgi:hypothetical protein|tara:strand:+ start:2577 stop:2783 length:207 start_codon:yes stop_codon:yes gene_type:complete